MFDKLLLDLQQQLQFVMEYTLCVLVFIFVFCIALIIILDFIKMVKGGK